MRFNEKEIKTLAAQHKCEKEGNLYFRERQEGFFRKEGDLNDPPTPSLLTFSLPRRRNFLRDHLMTRPVWVLKQSLHPSWHVCLSKVVIMWTTSSVHKRAEKIIADFIYIMLWAWPGKGLEWVEVASGLELAKKSSSSRPLRKHLKAFSDDSSRKQPIFWHFGNDWMWQCNSSQALSIRAPKSVSPLSPFSLSSSLEFPDYSINLPRQNTT